MKHFGGIPKSNSSPENLFKSSAMPAIAETPDMEPIKLGVGYTYLQEYSHALQRNGKTIVFANKSWFYVEFVIIISNLVVEKSV